MQERERAVPTGAGHGTATARSADRETVGVLGQPPPGEPLRPCRLGVLRAVDTSAWRWASRPARWRARRPRRTGSSHRPVRHVARHPAGDRGPEGAVPHGRRGQSRLAPPRFGIVRQRQVRSVPVGRHPGRYQDTVRGVRVHGALKKLAARRLHLTRPPYASAERRVTRRPRRPKVGERVVAAAALRATTWSTVVATPVQPGPRTAEPDGRRGWRHGCGGTQPSRHGCGRPRFIRRRDGRRR